MKICVAGQGAFGQKHLDALKRIPDVEVTSLVGGNQDSTAKVAEKYGIKHHTGDLSEGIKRADAVILTTPTKMHFSQGEQVMRAGKHVLVEIPVTDSVEDAENLVKIAKETGAYFMVSGTSLRGQAVTEPVAITSASRPAAISPTWPSRPTAKALSRVAATIASMGV